LLTECPLVDQIFGHSIYTVYVHSLSDIYHVRYPADRISGLIHVHQTGYQDKCPIDRIVSDLHTWHQDRSWRLDNQPDIQLTTRYQDIYPVNRISSYRVVMLHFFIPMFLIFIYCSIEEIEGEEEEEKPASQPDNDRKHMHTDCQHTFHQLTFFVLFERNCLYLYLCYSGLWIRIRSRIGSGFSDFVDPDPWAGK
jgi:hypothetical protein